VAAVTQDQRATRGDQADQAHPEFWCHPRVQDRVSFVTGDCFTILAADLQDPPELIYAMIDKWLAGAKYVLCARQGRDDPLGSKIFSYLYYRLVRLLVSPNYPSEGYDLALMDRAILPYFSGAGRTPTRRCWCTGSASDPRSSSTDAAARPWKSRWTFWKKFNALVDSLAVFPSFDSACLSRRFLVSFGSFGYARSFWSMDPRRIKVRGFATMVTLMAFLLGVIIIMLGMIGEYLWRIFDEVNKRPEAVIDEIR